MNLIFVSLFNNLQEISSVDERLSHLLKQFSRLPSHLKEEKLGQIKLLLEGNCSLVEMKMPSVQEIPRGKGRPVGALNKKRKIIPESSTRRDSSKFEIVEGLAPGFKKRGRPPTKKTESQLPYQVPSQPPSPSSLFQNKRRPPKEECKPSPPPKRKQKKSVNMLPFF